MKNRKLTIATLITALLLPALLALTGCFEDHDRHHSDRNMERHEEHHDDHRDSDHR